MDLRAQFRGQDEVPILPDRLRARVSEDSFGRRIPGRNSKMQIPLDHRQRGILEGHAQFLLRLSDCLFGKLAVGYISRDAEYAGNFALGVQVGTFGGEISAIDATEGTGKFIGEAHSSLYDLAVPIH